MSYVRTSAHSCHNRSRLSRPQVCLLHVVRCILHAGCGVRVWRAAARAARSRRPLPLLHCRYAQAAKEREEEAAAAAKKKEEEVRNAAK